MTAQACSGSVFHEYESLLQDDEAFERALHAAAHSAGPCGQGVASSGDDAAASGALRLHGLFALIDVAVEMLAEAGLHHLLLGKNRSKMTPATKCSEIQLPRLSSSYYSNRPWNLFSVHRNVRG